MTHQISLSESLNGQKKSNLVTAIDLKLTSFDVKHSTSRIQYYFINSALVSLWVGTATVLAFRPVNSIPSRRRGVSVLSDHQKTKFLLTDFELPCKNPNLKHASSNEGRVKLLSNRSEYNLDACLILGGPRWDVWTASLSVFTITVHLFCLTALLNPTNDFGEVPDFSAGTLGRGHWAPFPEGNRWSCFRSCTQM